MSGPAQPRLHIRYPVKNEMEGAVRPDAEVRQDVEAEINWDPSFEFQHDILVSVKDGVVTLDGFTHSYSDRNRAERAAKRVKGVSAIANDITVKLRTQDEKTDPEIARAAISAIRSALPELADNLKIVVREGVVTIEGAVEWNFQREAAEDAVRPTEGIKNLVNLVTLKPKAQAYEIREKIENALTRSAQVEAKRIKVETDGSEVVLSGEVNSWAERWEAERSAWSAPGVTKVTNHIKVGTAA